MILNINGSSWSQEEVKFKLTQLGNLKNKQAAWICADLTLSNSNLISRLMWTVFAKHFQCTRELFYNVNLESSKKVLQDIGHLATPLNRELVPLYENAVAVFNQIAPKHRVELPIKKSQAKPVQTASVINNKVALVLKASEWLNEPSNQRKARDVTLSDQSAIQSAQRFFQELIKKQQQNQQTPVPFYYHATHLPIVRLLAEKQECIVSKAPMGPGVYVSTNDESPTYGKITFAIDNDPIESRSAFYFTAPRWKGAAYKTNRYDGLWVSVQENIPLKPETVAYIIADRAEIDSVKQKIENTPLDTVEVIDRQVANVVRYALDNILTQRNYPKEKWEPHPTPMKITHPYDFINSFLPKNAQHFAPLRGKNHKPGHDLQAQVQ